jgi:hypothetical protein
MKHLSTKKVILLLLWQVVCIIASAQAITTGYFNGHVFATFPTHCGGGGGYYNSATPLTGATLNGNTFTVNIGQTNPRNAAGCGTTVGNTVYGSTYTPGSMPLGNGWPAANVRTFDARYNLASTGGFTTFNFTSNLPYLTHFTVIDLDNTEIISMEFRDAAGIAQPIAGNIIPVLLSGPGSNPGIVTFPTATTIQLANGGAPGADPGYSFVILTNNIRSIRFQQTVNGVSGNSYDFTLSTGTTDHGDVPASYGDPQHYPTGTRLKLGNLAPDAEAAAMHSVNANGDNLISGIDTINDEDGVSFPVIANNGALSQVIPSYSVTATVSNTTGSTANAVAWIDWDNNGTFDAAEGVTATVPTGSTNVPVSFTWTGASLSGVTGTMAVYMRVRLTTDPITVANASSSATSRPFAIDGEVEDYMIPLLIILPEVMGSMTVKNAADCNKIVKWESKTESRISKYVLEQSADGVDFTAIADIFPKGNNSTYVYTHSNSKKTFYRLKLVDVDQSFTYSKVLFASEDCDKSKTASLQYSALSGTASLKNLDNGRKKISAYDATGRILADYSTNALQFDLNVANWNNGIYTIIVSTPERNKTMRFVKQ